MEEAVMDMDMDMSVPDRVIRREGTRCLAVHPMLQLAARAAP